MDDKNLLDSLKKKGKLNYGTDSQGFAPSNASLIRIRVMKKRGSS